MHRRVHLDDESALPWVAVGGGLLALVAILLEVWGSWGTGANPRPPASWLVPSGWPVALRVAWWSAATVGVYLANRGLARLTHRPRRVVTTLSVLLFLGFTLGVATGAEWATWH